VDALNVVRMVTSPASAHSAAVISEEAAVEEEAGALAASTVTDSDTFLETARNPEREPGNKLAPHK